MWMVEKMLLNKNLFRFSVGVYIVKFFCSLGMAPKFVLYSAAINDTKQIFPHNPEIPTQPTLLHSMGWIHGFWGCTKALINHFYMYICNYMKITKRSWAFFAMEGNGEIRVDTEICPYWKRNYTNIHEYARTYTGQRLVALGTALERLEASQLVVNWEF